MHFRNPLRLLSFSKRPSSLLLSGVFVSLIQLNHSCKGINFNDEDSYGLRLVTIHISPEEYGLLNGQLLSKRPAQAEIRVAGELKVNCRASYAGRSSLDSFRKSYDVDFCDKRYEKRSSYRLTAQAIDKTMLRSLMGYEVFKAAGVEVPRNEPATLYINRKYHGVYIFMETVDKEFFKAHKLSVDEIFKARYANAHFKQSFASKISEAFSYEGHGEDRFTYIEQIYKLLWLEPNDDIFAAKLSSFMDIESFLSYAAAATFINHWDGFDNNYFLAYNTDTRKLVTVPWDLDRIWEKPEGFSPESLIERNALMSRLIRNPQYKAFFIGKLQKLQSEFPIEKLVESLHKREDFEREAYKEDPILSRYQTTAFDELAQKMTAWSLVIQDYLARNPT